MFLTPAEQTLYDMKMKNVNEVLVDILVFGTEKNPKETMEITSTKRNTPPKFNSSPLKNDGGKTILSF